MYVCICICVCVHERISKTACPVLTNFLRMLPMAVGEQTTDNSEVSLRTGLAPVSDRITRGLNAIFGHVARLPDNTPAHQAMLRQVELSVSRPPDPTWKRPPGRPRAKWTDQLCRDTNNVPIATLWRQAIGRGHSRATLRSEPTTR